MKDIKRILNPYIKGTYTYILPGISIFGLCIVASVNGHEIIAKNALVDFMLRVILTIYFCIIYISLTKDQKMENYLADNKDITGRLFLLIGGFFHAFGNGFITFLIMQKFFLYNTIENIVFSVINAILIFIPLQTGLPNSEYED